jgi:hypothetical protein
MYCHRHPYGRRKSHRKANTPSLTIPPPFPAQSNVVVNRTTFARRSHRSLSAPFPCRVTHLSQTQPSCLTTSDFYRQLGRLDGLHLFSVTPFRGQAACKISLKFCLHQSTCFASSSSRTCLIALATDGEKADRCRPEYLSQCSCAASREMCLPASGGEMGWAEDAAARTATRRPSEGSCILTGGFVGIWCAAERRVSLNARLSMDEFM